MQCVAKAVLWRHAWPATTRSFRTRGRCRRGRSAPWVPLSRLPHRTSRPHGSRRATRRKRPWHGPRSPLDGRERLRRLHHAAARVYRVTLLALPPSTLADHSSNRPVRELWNTIRLPSAHHEGVSSIWCRFACRPWSPDHSPFRPPRCRTRSSPGARGRSGRPGPPHACRPATTPAIAGGPPPMRTR